MWWQDIRAVSEEGKDGSRVSAKGSGASQGYLSIKIIKDCNAFETENGSP